MKTTRTGLNNCPGCKRAIDSASDIGGEQTPQPDDITICLYCASVCQFTKDMDIQLVPPVVIYSWSQEKQIRIQKFQQAILDINHEGAANKDIQN